MIHSRIAALLLATVALASCGQSNDSAAPKAEGGSVKAVAAPAGTSWAQQVVETPEGIRMGNPDAAIKIVEYGSYTCSHCRDFQAEGHEIVERDYVNTGKISFEYRNMIRDPLDLTVALIAHCGGPEAYFAMNTALFANQDAMIQQFTAHSQAEQQSAASLAPNQRFGRMAELANLIEFAKQRGLPEDKVRTCLADVNKAQKLAGVGEAAMKQFPQFPGTPSFLLNGTLLDNTASWSALQTRLRDAGA